MSITPPLHRLVLPALLLSWLLSSTSSPVAGQAQTAPPPAPRISSAPPSPVVPPIAPVDAPSAATSDAPRSETSGDVLVTLRAADDLGAAFDLDRMQPAGRLVDGELILDEAELVYGLFETGRLSFGFRTDELALLVDLGDLRVPAVTTPADLAPRPAASVYHSLRLVGGKFYYERPIDRATTLKAAQAVLGNYPVSGAQQLVPEIGHVYLLHLRAPKALGAGEQLVKFQVLAVDEQQLTLRLGHLREPV